MQINKIQNGETVLLKLAGKLDIVTAKDLEATLPSLVGFKELILDFTDLVYISSAGLRVLLLIAQQADDKGNKLVIKNVCDDVMEIFEMTGFSDILTIEQKKDEDA